MSDYFNMLRKDLVDLLDRTLSIRCPECGRNAGHACVSPPKTGVYFHSERLAEAKKTITLTAGTEDRVAPTEERETYSSSGRPDSHGYSRGSIVRTWMARGTGKVTRIYRLVPGKGQWLVEVEGFPGLTRPLKAHDFTNAPSRH